MCHPQRGSHEQLEPVAGRDALSAVERAQPPAFHAARVLLQDGEDVTLAEGQLLWGLGYIVVQGSGQEALRRSMTEARYQR